MKFCSICNKKYPTIKRESFKTLPNVMLIVLKRFDFDYQTMRRLKLDDYFEFPHQLDMRKYSQQNL